MILRLNHCKLATFCGQNHVKRNLASRLRGNLAVRPPDADALAAAFSPGQAIREGGGWWNTSTSKGPLLRNGPAADNPRPVARPYLAAPALQVLAAMPLDINAALRQRVLISSEV